MAVNVSATRWNKVHDLVQGVQLVHHHDLPRTQNIVGRHTSHAAVTRHPKICPSDARGQSPREYSRTDWKVPSHSSSCGMLTIESNTCSAESPGNTTCSRFTHPHTQAAMSHDACNDTARRRQQQRRLPTHVTHLGQYNLDAVPSITHVHIKLSTLVRQRYPPAGERHTTHPHPRWFNRAMRHTRVVGFTSHGRTRRLQK